MTTTISSQQDDWAATSRCMVALLAAMAGFVLNDAFMKVILETLPLGQALFMRSLFALLILSVIATFIAPIPVKAALVKPLPLLRNSLEVLGNLCFLTALMHMPLANLAAILQAVPLTVTAGAALFMGMAVGWRRWSAIGVGLIGVILVIDPRIDGFNAWSLLGLATVLIAAARDLITRKIDPSISALSLLTITMIFLGLTGLGIGLAEDWIWPGGVEIACLFAASFLIMMAHFAIVLAMRTGNFAAAAPIRYTGVIIATIVGYLVWGDVPNTMMIIGTCIIVASGLYAYLRERHVSRPTSP